MAGPNETSTASSVTTQEGVSEQKEALSLGLSEEKIRRIIGKRIDDGKKFYDKELDLTKTRENNEKRWLNKNMEVAGREIYDYQIPYKDNRIFLSAETLTAQLVSKIPEPEVIEAFDTVASRELAHGYEKVLVRTAEDECLKSKLRMITRHLIIGYRIGVIKVEWDFDKGRVKDDGSSVGGVSIKFVRPHKIVIDADANDPDDLPLIAENISTTLEDLIRRFPEKRADIVNNYAGGRKIVDLGDVVHYWEAWFTYYDGEQRKEGVAWKMDDTILGFGPNPYYNYKGGKKSNFLDRAPKPYVLFNFLRLGKWAYDDTSLTEQAAPLQDILEKRGHQIVDNADQANAAKVFNVDIVNAGDAEKYTGDPNDNIMASGDARTAFARVPAPELPRYVVEDKYDARQEIDNIFGTHAPLRGEKTKSPTLGQEVLSQKSDLGRLNALSESLEEGATKVYRLITQIYKVFATEEHMFKYAGDEGPTTFIRFNRDKIEDGIEIRVKTGTLRPEDKLSDRNEAVELAKIGGRIDPMTFAEKWHLDKPREFAKRMFYFMFMPDRYAQEVLKIGTEEGNDQAVSTIQLINAGENVPPKKNADADYVAAYNQYLQTPAFRQLDPEVQRLHIEHIRGTVESSKQELKENVKSETKESPLSRLVKRLRGGKNAESDGEEA